MTGGAGNQTIRPMIGGRLLYLLSHSCHRLFLKSINQSANLPGHTARFNSGSQKGATFYSKISIVQKF